ncbi:cytokinin dehydrogenase 3-like protein [Tanacetum coccineum]
MEHGFLSQKGSGGGRGVKEKHDSTTDKSLEVSKHVNINDEPVAIEVQSPSMDQTNAVKTCRGSYPPLHVQGTTPDPMVNTLDVGPNAPLPTQEAISAGNVPGKPSYATISSNPNGKKVNICTLFTPGGNRIDVVVVVDYMHAISERFANTAYGFFLGKKVAYLVVANYVKLHGVPVTAFGEDGLSAIATKLGTPLMVDSYTSDMSMQSLDRSSYARVMIELRADVELKDNIVVAMPKITREGHYTCNVRVEYEWKPPRCSSCKVFGHIHKECLKNTGFKPQKEYRPVTKNPNASSSGNKKKGVEPIIEWGTSNLVNNGATSSGSSFMNIDNNGEFASNTPFGEKIDKIERQIYEGKLRLLDNDRNPLVPTGIVESDSEVEVIFDETANLRISTSGKDGSDQGYGTNNLLEQWRDSYPDNDDYDPYDDNMYKNHDLSEHLQSIYDDLDITVRGRKKTKIF